MVRLSPQNRERSIDLLDDYDAGELVRESKRTEAPGGGRPCDQRRVKAVRASNYERQRACREQPALQLLRQVGAGPACADSGQSNQIGALRYASAKSISFLSPLTGNIRCPARLPHLVLSEGDVAL